MLFKYEEANNLYKDAINMDGGNLKYHLIYIKNLNTLGKYDEAIKHAKIALELEEIKTGNKKFVSVLYNNLGVSWESKSKLDKAISYYEKSIELKTEVYGSNNPNIAFVYNNLGLSLKEKGNYNKAIEYFKKTLEVVDTSLQVGNLIKGNALVSLCDSWRLKGKYNKAIGYCQQALDLGLRELDERHPQVATYYGNLGLAWKDKGRFGYDHRDIGDSLSCYDKAITYYNKALEIDTLVFGLKHPYVALRYNNIGLVWNLKGELDKAMVYIEKALEIDLKVFGKYHTKIANYYSSLGTVSQNKGESIKAIELYTKALQINKGFYGDNHPKIALDYNNLGLVWSSKGDYNMAIDYFERSKILLNQFFEPSHTFHKNNAVALSEASYYRGMELFQEKKHSKALGYFQNAYQNAKILGETELSLLCIINIGVIQKYLKKYNDGLMTLNLGIKKTTDYFKDSNSKIYSNFINEFQFHKIGCLLGLKRNNEANLLAKELWSEAIQRSDKRILDDLRLYYGYNF